jgi:AcrR family transcriptional regulator
MTTSIDCFSETQAVILDAAEAIFAERGKDGASVSEILARAGVKNRAAVNYYFRSKDELYRAAVYRAHQCCMNGAEFPSWPDGTDPKLKLRGFIRTMVARMMQPLRPSAMQLLMREMAQPTETGVAVVREYIQPIAFQLRQILLELLSPETPESQLWLVGFSIMGQCLYWRQNRAVSALLMGDEAFGRFDVDSVASHIEDFSVNALTGLQGQTVTR